MGEFGESPLGLLSFLSFALSIIAAVMAIDMYKLLRTGEFGKTWRLLIIATVMFALLQVLRLARILDFTAINAANLAQVVELCFVITLAYAFYSQRKVFTAAQQRFSNTHSGDDHLHEDESFLATPEDDVYEEDAAPRKHYEASLEPVSVEERREGRMQFAGSDITRPRSPH